MNRPESPGIPDVQSAADLRALAIDRVGIRDLRYPIRFEDTTDAGEPAIPSTIATFGVYVALPADSKGRTCRAWWRRSTRPTRHCRSLRCRLDERAAAATRGRRRKRRHRVPVVRAQVGAGIRRGQHDGLHGEARRQRDARCDITASIVVP
jgi:hypothetical protein